jgi:hypothetical protein
MAMWKDMGQTTNGGKKIRTILLYWLHQQLWANVMLRVHMYLLILVGSWILISLGQVVRLGSKVSKLKVPSFVAIAIRTQSDNQLIF